MEGDFQTSYAEYLADVRRLLLSQHAASSRFFSNEIGSSWSLAPLISQPAPRQQTLPPQPKSFFSPPPLPAAVKPVEPLKTAVPPIIELPKIKEIPVKPVVIKVSENISSVKETPLVAPAVSSVSSSHRLVLQPPIAIEVFAAEEWKQRLAQLAPTLKTYDAPPMPFGQNLWGASPSDWLVLFIESNELTAASERFVQAIKDAMKMLCAPIGCLPMQALTTWNLQAPALCMPLRNLESYMQDPLQKKALWAELQKRYQPCT